MQRLNKVLNLMWKHKWIIIALLPVPIVYYGFIQRYVYLAHHNSNARLFNYFLLELVPALTILSSMLLFRLKLDKGLAVVTSMLVNSYAVYTILPYWGQYYWKLLLSKGTHIIAIYHQWELISGMSGFWFYGIDWMQMCLIASAFWFLIRNRTLINFNRIEKGQKSTNYGTSKFLDRKGIYKLINRDGIVVGAIPKTDNFSDAHQLAKTIRKCGGGELIRVKADHAILVAPSGSGKNVGVIMPTLLDYPGPVFVTDIKGENYSVTKRAREAKGRKVFAFDPFGITDAPKIRINPLQFLDPNSKDIVDDIQTLAELICPNHEKVGSTAEFFQSQASNIVKCFTLHVISKFPEQDKTLYTVYSLLSQTDKELSELLGEIGADDNVAFGEAAKLAKSFFSTAHEERSGILNTARLEMRFLGSPYVREATEVSDVNVSDITNGDMDLFVCIPPNRLSDQKKLLRLLTGIVFIEMQRAQGRIGKHNLLMLIDEMPALGHLKQVENILAYGRGYGVSLLVVSQTIQNLKAAYPNTWEAFFSSQLSMFFGCAEPTTAEFVAKKIGKSTIEISSVSQSEGIQKRVKGGGESVQSGNSTSETGREGSCGRMDRNRDFNIQAAKFP